MVYKSIFLKQERNIKIFSIVGIGINTYSILFIILFCILNGFGVSLNDSFFILLLVSWIYNILLVFYVGFGSEKHYIWKLSELYLILTIFSPLFMLLGNFLVSTSYFPTEIVFYSIITYFGLISLSICGFLISYYMIVSILGLKNLKLKKGAKRNFKKRRIACKTFLIIGFLYAISVINGSANYAAGILAAAAQVSLGLLFAFVAFLLLLIKTKPGKINLIVFSGISIITISACLLPLLTISTALDQANVEFSNAFGTDWEGTIETTNLLFLEKPFSLSKYFLGELHRSCRVLKDVLYYVGEGVELYFDVYLPPSDNLPGNNSVLISIHGGGWSLADKGFTNKIQNNKYFASQGYVVFDIQYGLKNLLPFGMITPENVKGNFTINDMVRHIGIFTHYLAAHWIDYNANLNSVFFTGGSSGGQLACAVAFAYHDPSYSSLFNQSLKINGLIPLYPANGIASSILNIPGSLDLVQPECLVNESSPPCLVIHGSSDGIVDPQISVSLKNKYLHHNNTKIARILLPFAGHILDYYFTGIYNQACLYYMERFLYLFH